MSLGELPDKTKLTAWIHRSNFFAEAFGTKYSVAEIGEQFGWLGAALRSSIYKTGVTYCTPFVSNVSSENTPHSLTGTSSESDILCKIKFILQESEVHLAPSNGQCWHGMFKNPVVVKGYPIKRRIEHNTGLEIPLNIMAGLVRTRRVNVFNGNLFIKGFSTILVLKEHIGDLLIWHLLYNKDGNHISYLDNAITPAENFSVFDLEKARHVVGWCSEVKYYAGKNDAKIVKISS